MSAGRITLRVATESAHLYAAALAANPALRDVFTIEERPPAAFISIGRTLNPKPLPVSAAPRPVHLLRLKPLPVSNWIPLCMSTDEYGGWLHLNDKLRASQAHPAKRPCEDCPASYAAEMRAKNVCNGHPGLDR